MRVKMAQFSIPLSCSKQTCAPHYLLLCRRRKRPIFSNRHLFQREEDARHVPHALEAQDGLYKMLSHGRKITHGPFNSAYVETGPTQCMGIVTRCAQACDDVP